MNTPKVRNRIRLTSAEQKRERDEAQRELNRLTTKLTMAYLGPVVATVIIVLALAKLGGWLL